jgi:hypothetical protein
VFTKSGTRPRAATSDGQGARDGQTPGMIAGILCRGFYPLV